MTDAPARPAHERRPRPHLPRDRRHARGQGRARLQDRRLPPGRRHDRSEPGRPGRRLPGGDAAAHPGRRARRSATRSRSSPPPGTWRSTTACALRSRRGSWSCCGSRVSAPRPCDSCTSSCISPRWTTCARRPRPAACASCEGMSAKTEALVLEGIARLDATPDRMLLDRAETTVAGVIEALAADARRPRPRAGRIVPPAPRDDRRPRHPRGDRRRAGPDRAVHDTRQRGPRGQRGGLQGGGPPAARPAGRPDGHAARRGRDVPDPLHGLQGAQRPPARDGARPGLVALGEGVPADRRGRRTADRRRRRAPDVRHRDARRTRSSDSRSSSPSCARTPGRSRRRSRAGSRTSSMSATFAATCTATRTGPTVRTPSRSWPRPHADAATPTRCSPTTRSRSRSPAA